MQLDDRARAALDRTFSEYTEQLRSGEDQEAAVTLAYTHRLHRAWWTVLQMLPMDPEWRVLDMGCGLGILSFELAANLPFRITGVDINSGFIGHCEVLASRLRGEGLLRPDSVLEFRQGDIHRLDLEDESFDFVFIRELLQFLPDPVAAVTEVLRVLRPGGYLCISDTDDQLRITWPPPNPHFETLVDAVTGVQLGRGGDRETGRKLTTYLRRGGFDINSVVVLPEAQHRPVDPADAEQALIIEQLHAARDRVVESGLLSAEEYDTHLAALESQTVFEEFRMNARIIVLGQRPVTTPDVPAAV